MFGFSSWTAEFTPSDVPLIHSYMQLMYTYIYAFWTDSIEKANFSGVTPHGLKRENKT